MTHWRNAYESNIQSARYILAHAHEEPMQCLLTWARMIVERAGLSSPLEPGQAEVFGDEPSKLAHVPICSEGEPRCED